jgi:acyl-coenzyme A thioesterase PaaI-like protein
VDERAVMTGPEDASAAAREELTFPDSGACFGCSPTNPGGLRLRFFRDGDGVLSVTTVPGVYQGAPGVVHGGIQAVLLDEVSCAAAFFRTGSRVVTGSLALRYRRTCPTGRALHVRAEIVADEQRHLVVRSEIRNAESGELLTMAEGKFYRDRGRDGA